MLFLQRKKTRKALTDAGFSATEADVLSRHATVRSIKIGERLTKLGGYSDKVFLLTKGSLTASRPSMPPREVEINTGSPVVIGEISALRDRLFAVAEVVASADSEALVFPASRLSLAMGLSPRLSEIVNTQRAARLQEMDNSYKKQRLKQWDSYQAYVKALSRSNEVSSDR